MAAFQRFDLLRHLVHADHVMAEIGKTRTGNKADITGTDHHYPHSSSFRFVRRCSRSKLQAKQAGAITPHCLAAFTLAAKRHDQHGLTSFRDGDMMASAGQICRTLRPSASMRSDRVFLRLLRLALIGSRV
jgi:hypothetical protein